ncbi:hypothetical protein U1Q18_039639 [Sarracenia purpurea var. burkii]
MPTWSRALSILLSLEPKICLIALNSLSTSFVMQSDVWSIAVVCEEYECAHTLTATSEELKGSGHLGYSCVDILATYKFLSKEKDGKETEVGLSEHICDVGLM